MPRDECVRQHQVVRLFDQRRGHDFDLLRIRGAHQAHRVATAEGRGPDGWYYDAAEADVFEMWADLAQHYNLDSWHVTIYGFSF